MSHRRVKPFLMQLIERDHPGKSIEQILVDAYCEHGTERAAAPAMKRCSRRNGHRRLSAGIYTSV